MADQNQNEQAQEQAQKAPAREIIRGRMPVAVVHLVRHGAQREKSTREKAEAFGTTVGKIDDIVKGRNFGYVDENFVPTAQQKADAKAWLERHPTGCQEILDELEALPTASEEQAAAFESARAAARGQSPKTKDGEEANGGGGNRRKGRGKKAESAENSAATGDALLS